MNIHVWHRTLIGLFYPAACAGCGCFLSPEYTGMLCRVCYENIQVFTLEQCHCCGRFLPKYSPYPLICPDCAQQTSTLSHHLTCGPYEGLLKKLIQKFKYEETRSLSHDLGTLMHQKAESCFLMNTIDLITAVPLSAHKYHQRSFNQSYDLASHLARAFEKPVFSGLKKQARTLSQSHLDRTARLHNVKNAFVASSTPALLKKHVLLIDDVITTGATLHECATTLLHAGARQVTCFALARSM